MNQNKFDHFFTYVIAGVGLGILVTLKEESSTYEAIEELIDSVKNIDAEETKKVFFKKIDYLKKELSNIDKNEAIEIVKEKLKMIKIECDTLMLEAKKNSLPLVETAVKHLKISTIQFLKTIETELESDKSKN